MQVEHERQSAIAVSGRRQSHIAFPCTSANQSAIATVRKSRLCQKFHSKTDSKGKEEGETPRSSCEHCQDVDAGSMKENV
jgi:hypothetical protein